MEEVYFLVTSSLIIAALLVFNICIHREEKVISLNVLEILMIVAACYLFFKKDSVPTIGWNGALVTLYQFLILFFLLPSFIRKHYLERNIWILILVLSAFESILGIIQFAGILNYSNSSFKLGGTFINPSAYGCFLSIVTPILFAGLFILNPLGGKRTSKVILSIVATVCVVASILSFSRTSWIAILLSTIFILLCKYREPLYKLITGHKKRRIAIYLIAVGSVTIFLSCLTMFKKDSTLGRWFIYKQSLRLLPGRSLTGIGLHKFGKEYNLSQAAYFESNKATPTEIMLADNINIATSDALQVVVELGIVGLVLVSIGIGCVLLFAIRNIGRVVEEKRVYQIGGCGAVISFLICVLLSYPMHIISVMSVGLILCCMIDFSVRNAWSGIRLGSDISRILIALVCTYSIIIIVDQVRLYKVERKWLGFRALEGVEEYTNLKPEFDALLPTLQNNYLFVTDYATIAYKSGDYQVAVNLFNKSNLIYSNYLVYMYLGVCYQRLHQKEKAYHHFQMACNMVPNRFLPKYYLFLFYVSNRNFESAMALKEKINSMPVKIPSRQIELIKDEVNNTVLF
ncbi:O-antigen ligase family protein [Chitinophaga terrae (ex Kim and Jung 2007)]|nr:O-antigen ligase family protein [Chitinophaga terrae (ex Kim and Jung 2007)]